MYYNFPDLTSSEVDNILDADICIVGTGAAGISMALQFIKTNKRVLLLEGGTIGVTEQSQKLYHGPTVENGVDKKDYLASSRIRMFGGTTGHWAGYCRPFDEIDFEVRDWVPNSGWPITMSDLIPHYDMTSALLQIKPFDMSNDLAIAENRVIDTERFKIRNYHLSPPTRFHETFRSGLQKPEHISVVFDANVININLVEDGSRVMSLDIASLNDKDKKAKVKAKQFVLATGGIENVKLLLNSNDVKTKGIGNDNDNVGKYFMEHPEYDSPYAMALAIDDVAAQNFVHFGPTRQLPSIMPTAKTQRQHKILNASVELRRYKPSRATKKNLENATKSFAQLDPANENYKTFTTFIRTEMPPIASNRCYLVDDKDTFGNQNVGLSYSVDESSEYTVQTLAKTLGRELGQNGIGRLNTSYKTGDHKEKMLYGWHHMGTTRMSASPEDGVVDKNCQVFGVSNLYIAGSSVFSTSSYANPTFNLVALALRLADYLKSTET